MTLQRSSLVKLQTKEKLGSLGGRKTSLLVWEW
jgi:hypothetical protein